LVDSLARRSTLIAGGAVAAALAGAATFAQRRHLKAIASDPASELLRELPSGAPMSVTSADGTKLHAEQFGPQDAPAIVLVHGWTERISYWTYVIRDLKRDHRVIAYDLRGHGESDSAAREDYSLVRFGEDLEAVLAACAPDRRVRTVAGHSLGAMSVAAWAEHHDVTARTESAALLNTGLGGLIAGAALVAVPAFAERLADPIGRKLFLGSRRPIPNLSNPLQHAIIRHVAFGPDASPGQLEFYARMVAAAPPDVRAAVGLAMADMELHHALARLIVPTLVLAGADDRLTPPEHARRIAAELPQLTQLIELPRTGHMGPLERPAEIAAALRELAAGVGGGSRIAA
jgi:pimeloyl-ACP methyl ester carboxylesterase